MGSEMCIRDSSSRMCEVHENVLLECVKLCGRRPSDLRYLPTVPVPGSLSAAKPACARFAPSLVDVRFVGSHLRSS